MPWYNLATSVPKNRDETNYFYNGIDCLVEYEVFDDLRRQIDEAPYNVRETYEFSLAKQAPIMEMELRGIRVNPARLNVVLDRLDVDYNRLTSQFNDICLGVFSRTFNPRSHIQVKQLFYEYLALPPVKARNSKGVWAPSSNNESLEKLKQHFYAQPFVSHVLALRDMSKQMGMLKGLKDERLYTSFSIAGTNTGRLASKFSDFGVGTNLQNVDRRLRGPFVADSGHTLVNIDLEQADSRNVGARCWELFYESYGAEWAGRYLDACESEDLHTTVAHMVWPDLTIKQIKEELFHGQDTYRQTAKKCGHATNYYAKAVTLGKRVGLPTFVVQRFQDLYEGAFPCIPEWQNWVGSQRHEYPATLTTFYGRRRNFWGRSDDDSTLREMLAYEPQSMTGHQIDSALHALWRLYPQIQLLVQVHDSILFQIPSSDTHLIPEFCEVMQDAHTITLAGGRKFFVPVEAKIGNNWGEYDEETNPTGLRKLD